MKENSIEEDIEILEEMIENANIENMDMNNCFGGEHIEAIEHILSDYDFTMVPSSAIPALLRVAPCLSPLLYRHPPVPASAMPAIRIFAPMGFGFPFPTIRLFPEHHGMRSERAHATRSNHLFIKL